MCCSGKANLFNENEGNNWQNTLALVWGEKKEMEHRSEYLCSWGVSMLALLVFGAG